MSRKKKWKIECPRLRNAIAVIGTGLIYIIFSPALVGIGLMVVYKFFTPSKAGGD